jgi:hypothetical protein
MLMVVVLSTAILLVTAFCLKSQRLHLFEIMAIWLTAMAVNSPIYTFYLLNLKWMSVPESRELAVVRIVYSELLTPLFIVWVLDWILVQRQRFIRFAGYLAAITLLFMGGWLLNKWGAVHFYPPGWWGYAPAKAVLLMAAVGAARLIRYLMRKDGIPYGPISRH